MATHIIMDPKLPDAMLSLANLESCGEAWKPSEVPRIFEWGWGTRFSF